MSDLSPSRKRATEAQTRLLLLMWLERRAIPHKTGQGTSTMEVLVKRGWVVPTERTYIYPNGEDALMYALSAAGLLAAKVGFANVSLPKTDPNQ